MTRQEIISNSGVLLVAGSETVATLLSGATFHLLKNPSVLEKLQAEIRAAFGSEDDITLLSVGTLGRLPYMEAVLMESLRIYPPIPANLPRMTEAGGEIIDGNFVPPNVRCDQERLRRRYTNHSADLRWCAPVGNVPF